MILNERQYGITKTKIKEFEQAQAKLINSPVPENRNEQLRHKAYLDTINNQLEVLRREIQEYEELKKGDIKIRNRNRA